MHLHRPQQTKTSDLPEEPPKPCWFMKGMLDSLSEDTLTGVPQWYAETHAEHCPACSAALASSRALRNAAIERNDEEEAAAKDDREREASASTYTEKERQEDQT